MSFFRIILLALFIYLVVSLFKKLLPPGPSKRPEVKGDAKRSNRPLDLEGKDVEDAKFEDIDE